MHELTVLLTEDERGLIGNELDKLYSFQDRPLPKDKKSHLVSEISSHGYPFPAIIKGIRDLFSEELKRITLADILSACRDNIFREEDSNYDCEHCDSRGVVILSDGIYEKSFACTCKNSDKWISSKLAKWQGDTAQIVNGKNYFIPARFLK